ncbi:MAG: sodium-extruding oxaloacetate decarboxylase subunit alpha [Chloroflexi bacterium]|nr:sodium-extruding oxaloacetate decarboxylase subunit alpha [Chloroflexota bacterium]
MGVLITDTTLRDAHQSLIATRMRTRDMLPIAEELDKVGFFSLEVWGGATFDSCIRFLNEDPWDRIKELRERVKNTRLQMLLRGQNLVGYRHYPDDVVREFIRLAVKNGVDVFRVFDALNDMRNIDLAIRVAKEYGAHVQGSICYTTSPVHTVESFSEMAEELERLGCDSICIKDMAGLISPAATTDLVKAIKSRTSIPVDLHSHCSSGMAPLSYHAAALAGIDILDTAFSAFGWGTSQPPTESIVAALKDTPYDPGLDLELLYEIGEHFAALSSRYRVLFTAETTRPNINVLLHQIPGGMLSNLVSQLKEQNALERLNEVLGEVPRVRADLGYPPLVTPTSQVVGIQAVLNVLAGGRYKKVTQEVKNYLLGLYGRPPGKVNEEVRKAVIGDEEPIDVRPADLLEPELEKLRSEAEDLDILRREEDLITYALYPQVATKFLRGELKEERLPTPVETGGSPAPPPASIPLAFSVDVDGEIFNVKILPILDGGPGLGEVEKPKELPPGAVVCPMPGMMLSVKVSVGDRVNEGDVVAVIEAMKMQNDIHAPHSGVVKEVSVQGGDMVGSGDILMVVEPNGE